MLEVLQIRGCSSLTRSVLALLVLVWVAALFTRLVRLSDGRSVPLLLTYSSNVDQRGGISAHAPNVSPLVFITSTSDQVSAPIVWVMAMLMLVVERGCSSRSHLRCSARAYLLLALRLPSVVGRSSVTFAAVMMMAAPHLNLTRAACFRWICNEMTRVTPNDVLCRSNSLLRGCNLGAAHPFGGSECPRRGGDRWLQSRWS